MSAKRLYYALVGSLALLAIALVAGAYGVNSLLASESHKLTTLKAKDQALAQEQISLAKAKQDIKQYASLKKIAQSVVPEDKNQAEAVREIVNIAETNNISLAAVNFPASSLGNTTTGGTATTAPAAATPAPAPNAKTGALSQLLPVKNIPGVYELPITVQGDPKQPVRYDKFVSFLSALEHNRRTAQVSNISLTPSTDNPNLLSFTLNLNEYIKP